MPQARHATAADAAAEAHRHAYNAAFCELDMSWHWDAQTFERLQPGGAAAVRRWLEAEQPHLLRAYSADFLVDVIERTKERCLAAITPPAHAARAETHLRLAA